MTAGSFKTPRSRPGSQGNARQDLADVQAPLVASGATLGWPGAASKSAALLPPDSVGRSSRARRADPAHALVLAASTQAGEITTSGRTTATAYARPALGA
jgi:hypothetical protein